MTIINQGLVREAARTTKPPSRDSCTNWWFLAAVAFIIAPWVAAAIAILEMPR